MPTGRGWGRARRTSASNGCRKPKESPYGAGGEGTAGSRRPGEKLAKFPLAKGREVASFAAPRARLGGPVRNERRNFAILAQLVEHRFRKPKVIGSIPMNGSEIPGPEGSP